MPVTPLPKPSKQISPIFKGENSNQNPFNTNILETISVTQQTPVRILNSDELQDTVLDMEKDLNKISEEMKTMSFEDSPSKQ